MQGLPLAVWVGDTEEALPCPPEGSGVSQTPGQRVSLALSVSLMVFLSISGWAERCLHFEVGRVRE